MIDGVKPPSKTTIVSLMLFYLIFTFFVSIVFWILIADISTGADQRLSDGILGLGSTVFFVLAIGSSFFIIGFILFKLVKVKKRDPLQGGLKLRLLAYFAGFGVVLTIPQIVLAIILVFSTTSEWLPDNTENIILKSRAIVMKSRDDKIENLKQFSESEIFLNQVEKMVQTPSYSNFLWNDLVEINPFISGAQVYDDQGAQLLFTGDKSCHLDYQKISDNMQGGELPLTIYQEKSIFRYLLLAQVQGEEVKIIVSLVQPTSDQVLITDLTNLFEHYKPLIESREWMRTNIILVLILFFLIINLISIYISLYLSNLIILPIVDIERATQRVAGGDFSVRLYSDKNNNFGLLTNSFNKMVFDLEKLQKNSSHFNKMKAWQDIARRMAHEINNPLTPIRLSAERMLRKYQRDPENFEGVLEKSVHVIISEVENLQLLLNDFRAFSKLPEPKFENLCLLKLLEEAAHLYQDLHEKETVIDLERVDPGLMLYVDKGQIKQVFSNLIKNAIEAFDEKGEINISTTLVSLQNLKYCRIIVQDNGKGIPQDLLDNIFIPYYTTKTEGTGLGLSIVERIVFTHKGRIKVMSNTGKGTTFVIDLPLESSYE